LPRRSDLNTILIIGSGPIVIGQACEFDYSGTQACKVLREEGYRVVLINSNPATIMTDPELADRTYIEPITPAFVEKIIERERPDAILPTMGGQTALNTAVALAESGVLEKYGVELIGAKLESIRKAEDRELFKATMDAAGVETPRGGFVRSLEEARHLAQTVGPAIEHHPYFPQRTNAEFAFVKSPLEIDLVVWERGAGLTLACGTGACATVVAAILTGRCEEGPLVTVHLPGGSLKIRVMPELSNVKMLGPAVLVYDGVVDLAKLSPRPR